MATAVHVVLFPFPLHSHFLPILSFSQALASCGLPDIRVTIVHIAEATPQPQRPLPPNLHLLPLSDGLPPDFHRHRPANYLKFFSTLPTLGPALQLLLRPLHAAFPISSLVSDANCPWVVDVANHLRLPLFLFVTDSAATFAVSLHARRLLQDGFIGKGSPRDATALVDFIAGIPPLTADALPFPDPYTTEFFFETRLSMYDRIGEVAGVLVNTFYDLEREVVDGIRGALSVPVLPVGPCMPELKTEADDQSKCGGEEVLQWLDDQPPSSVIYVCFGSLAIPLEEQVREMWEGIILSGQPFLWSTRSTLAKELWRSGGHTQKGQVVDWVPQQKVLHHSAVGGFMTHCGWNSVLEAVTAGAPMLCCPFFLDQPLTCRFVVGKWKVGIDASAHMNREGLAKLIQLILIEDEGRRLKQRALELRNSARAPLLQGSILNFIKLLQGDVQQICQAV